MLVVIHSLLDTWPFQVKAKALTLAEMQAFLQNRRDEDKAAQEEIKIFSEALERYTCDVEIHSDFKQL